MLKRFKSRKLKPDEKKVVADVENYGWHVVLIKDEPGKPGFAFTVGLFESYGHPEVIIFGLKPRSRHPILNWIGDNVKKGNPFTAGRVHDWVLANYNCWSRKVQKKWYYHLLGYARWFYGNDDFPCVQAIWPAKDGTFPWEDGAHYSGPQPLLYEKDLVSARMMHFVNDEDLIKSEWPFACDPHLETFVSRCVVEDGKAIIRAFHDRDGSWQFIGPAKDIDADGCRLSCLHCVVERDHTIRALAALPRGWCAERESPAHKWEWSESEESEDDD